MSTYIDFELFNNERYKVYNLEFYTKGYLKGYAQGMIEFNNSQTHEFLYRVYDPENGNSATLVSIDYGFNNTMVDELWDEIESNLTRVIGNITIIGEKEDLEFWKTCKQVL